MTVELVTGFADTPHIDAADDGALNAAIISDSNHVLGTPSPAVMRDSNHLTVPTMEALFQGRHVRVTSAEDVTITSGSQGLKRHDIVGFRYSRDSSTNVETVVLDVIRGTASSTPADPPLPSGNILTGASSAFMPLYRVTLDGINTGTPVPLFNVLRPMRELWDSANQLPGIKSQISNLRNSLTQVGSLTPAESWNDVYLPLRIRVVAGVVTLAGAVRRTGGSFTAATTFNSYEIAHVSPAPSARVDVASMTNGSGTGGNCTVRIDTNGTISLINTAAEGINVTKGETYVSLGGVTYPID